MPLNALDIGSATPASKEHTLLAATTNAEPAGSDAFGQVMSRTLQQMGPAGLEPTQATGAAMPWSPLSLWVEGNGGQGLATQADTDKTGESTSLTDTPLLPAWMQAWPAGQVVEQVHVGPSLQAITAKDAVPDDASLAAFARAQGLDAHAIAWLLGPSVTAQPSQLASESPATSALQTLPSLAIPAAPGAAGTVTAPGTPALDAPSSRIPSVAAGAAALVSAVSWMSNPPVQQDASPAPAESTHDALAVLADKDSSPALSSLRWAQMAATDTSVSTPRLGKASEDKVWSESELDLSELSIPEPAMATDQALASDQALATDQALASGIDSPTPTPHAVPARDAPALAAHSASVATAHDKASASPQAQANRPSGDQMAQLADQMADAIGERMIREFERGHWNLRLMLKPAHLGHIEVEMRMRAGELDASFVAPQAATRELLQDGLSRLKESLNQMGMDVASLDVRTGQQRQNGGDPTPGQQPIASNLTNRETAEMPAQPTTAFVPRPRRADGWDVMV